MKQMTLCLVRDGNKILLGMKKRGFGVGRWNGFGGKVEEGETVKEGARRELREGAGIEAKNINEVGVVLFEFEKDHKILEVHIFHISGHNGEPVESEEMRPKWFKIEEIPFAQMWPDDIHWMPLFLAGKKFRGRFLFGEGDVILEKELNEVAEI